MKSIPHNENCHELTKCFKTQSSEINSQKTQSERIRQVSFLQTKLPSKKKKTTIKRTQDLREQNAKLFLLTSKHLELGQK